MGLLHTSATRFTRKFPIHRLPERAPYDSHPQGQSHCHNFFHFRDLVVYPSLHPSHFNRCVHSKDANRGV